VLLTVLGDASGFGHRTSVLIFGLSLVGLYTVSALYHSVPWNAQVKVFMQRLDHVMIHVLVAGTFTPIAVIVLDGWLQWATLGAQWGIVAVGIAQKFLLPEVTNLSVALQTTQGWLALLLLQPLATELPWTGIGLIVLGGVLYTAGMVMQVIRRPRLWPRVFSYHETFHIFVIAGSSVHFAAIAAYVA
jgi:hemolysin III